MLISVDRDIFSQFSMIVNDMGKMYTTQTFSDGSKRAYDETWDTFEPSYVMLFNADNKGNDFYFLNDDYLDHLGYRLWENKISQNIVTKDDSSETE